MRNKGLTSLFVAVILVGCVAGILVPAGIGWDFANFYDAGRRVAAGQSDDLYRKENLIAGELPQGTTGFFGTPISAAFYAPMAGLSPEAALVAFKIENVGAYFASLALLFQFYRRFAPAGTAGQWEFAAMFSGMGLLFQPFWTVFRVGGQTTPTVLLLLTLALIFHTGARFWGSALCVVAALLIKPALAPAVLFLVAVSEYGFLWRVAVVLAAVGAASLAWLGWAVHLDFVNLMLTSGQATYAWFFNSSIYIAIENVRGWAGAAATTGAYRLLFPVLTYAVQLGVLAAIVYLTRRGHREGLAAAARRHFDFLMTLMLFLFWSRTVWEHYLSLLFIPLAFVVASRARFSRPAWFLVAAILGLSVFQNLIFTNWLRASFELQSLPALLVIAAYKSGPLLLMLVFLWRHGGELILSHRSWPAQPFTMTATSAQSGR